MVFRLPLLSSSSLWIPLTVLLIAASLGIGRSKAEEWKDPYAPSPESIAKRNLTGIPQIDYLTDPNLPHELNGYNLSTYPFFNKVPTNITFKCHPGLKDGFYASIEHNCQLYHHCIFGTRHDFLCANYTAFDQRTFICQFVSEVDCPNSGLFWHRNDALYVPTTARTTSTQAPLLDYGLYQGRRRTKLTPSSNRNKETQTDLPAEPGAADRPNQSPNKQAAPARGETEVEEVQRGREGTEEPEDDYVRPYRRRRPKFRQRWRPRARPAYEDYYDDYYDDEPPPARRRPLPRRALARYEDDYYDTDSEEELPRRKMKVRKNRRKNQDPDLDYQIAADDASSKLSKTATTSSTTTTTTTTTTPEPPILEPVVVPKTRDELFSISRAPPKLKTLPFSRGDRGKFGRIPAAEQTSSTSVSPTLASSATQSKENVASKQRNAGDNSARPVEADQYDQAYYDEDYEQAQAPAKKSNKYLPLPTTTPSTTTTTTTTTAPTTRKTTTTTTTTPVPASVQQVYEYEYEDYEDDQPVLSNIPSTAATTTTTTTTTTTPRPPTGIGGSRKFRNNNQRKRQPEDNAGPTGRSQSQLSPSAPDVISDNSNKYSISSSSPGEKQMQITVDEAASETPSRNPSLRQPFTSRPRHTLFSNHKNNSPSSTTPVSTTTTIKTSVTTSERTVETIIPSRKALGGRFQSQTYKEVPSSTPASFEITTLRSRGSRYWTRAPNGEVPPVPSTTTTTTTTTTPAPDAADYAYYDETLPLTRYGQRSASTYPVQYSTGPEAPPSQSPSGVAPQSPSIAPVAVGSSYHQAQDQQDVYRSNVVDTRYEQSPLPRGAEQSNYVTPFATAPSLPQTTAADYLQYHQPHHQPSQSPPQPQNHQQYPQSQSHPEFISLLPEDEEDPYYPSGSVETGSSHIMSMIPSQEPKAQALQLQQPQPQQQQQQQLQQQQQQQQQIPQNRFRNQLTRMFTSPQELFPVYTTPPQYIKAIRPRHVYPTMFLPYATY